MTGKLKQAFVRAKIGTSRFRHLAAILHDETRPALFSLPHTETPKCAKAALFPVEL